jgi:lipopolysaccharide transport system ATP-binding protein
MESLPGADQDVVLSVRGVSKKFCRSLKKSLWYGVQDIAGELLGAARDNSELRPEEFWALKDVSFELRRGECLGLIGRNGAGKTTLLRMLNGLIKPDQGQIMLRGRLGSMIALGAGFNPVLTGKENVYVYASVLGLSRTEIDAQYEEIVDFAELHDFMDAPVGSYSSGMYIRLGFAVASTLQPDILIIDEVLAVGDADFRLKSAKRMRSLLNGNCAVILVSHNMTDIHNLATQAIWLDKGKIQKVGSPHEVISAYLGTGVWEVPDIRWDNLEEAPGCSAVKLRRLAVLPVEGEEKITISTGGRVMVEFDCFEEGLSLDCTIEVATEEGVVVFHTGTYISRAGDSKISRYALEGKLPSYFLNSGSYYLTIILGESQSIPLVKLDSILRFRVENIAKGASHGQLPGIVFPKLEWKTDVDLN